MRSAVRFCRAGVIRQLSLVVLCVLTGLCCLLLSTDLSVNDADSAHVSLQSDDILSSRRTDDDEKSSAAMLANTTTAGQPLHPAPLTRTADVKSPDQYSH